MILVTFVTVKYSGSRRVRCVYSSFKIFEGKVISIGMKSSCLIVFALIVVLVLTHGSKGENIQPEGQKTKLSNLLISRRGIDVDRRSLYNCGICQTIVCCYIGWPACCP